MTTARIEDVSALAQAFGADMGDVKPNVRKNSFDATRAPLPSDDETQGYAVGSRWQWQGREWLRTLTGWILKDITATPQLFGAAADGTTDDRPAFVAAEAAGVSPVAVTGQHFLSTAPSAANIAYRLNSDASVTLGSGAWNPRRYYKDGVTPFDRKVNFASQNPTIPPEAYTGLSDSHQAHYYWINQWGYQEPDTNGNLSGAFSGPFPPGQSRLARSGAQQIKLEALHSGMGDGYNLFGSMAAVPQRTSLPVTNWSGQNSAGFTGFQVNALGAKVNLYGIGDCVLDDKGFSDVAMLGHVSFIKREGADSGAYGIPRFGFLMVSRGSLPLDHAYGASGPFHVGLDLARASFASNFAIMLGATHRLGFDGSGALSGKFTTNIGGSYYIHKANSPDRLEIVAGDTPILRLYSDRAEVNRGVDSMESLRVRGASATAMASIGQAGAVSYFSALSTGAEATTLVLRAADATGAEQILLSMTGSGRMTAPRMLTYADNAAALAAGRAVGDIYKTATGELRIVV